MKANKKPPRELPAELSLSAICYLLGVNKQRVAQLAEAGIVERTARGRYSITSVPRFIDFQRKSGAGPKELLDVRIALLNERLQREQFERRLREGEVGNLREYDEMHMRERFIVRQNMLGLPAASAPKLLNKTTPAEVFTILDADVREILERTAITSSEQMMAVELPTSPKEEANNGTL
jgi:hypothetical protein